MKKTGFGKQLKEIDNMLVNLKRTRDAIADLHEKTGGNKRTAPSIDWPDIFQWIDNRQL
jgi:hypothetical protein